MSERKPHRVAMLAYPEAQILDVVGPLEVFSRAARLIRDQGHSDHLVYEVEVIADGPGPVRMSSGLEVIARRSWRHARGVDTLLVAGGLGYRTAFADPALLAWLRRQRHRSVRMGSICTGALILGEAGLLHGQRATTHWAYCDQLARQCPDTKVEPDAIYVRNGNLYTSAGVTAGLDLALALLEEDWGRRIAVDVARELVLFLKRPGGQSQFSTLLSAQATGTERFRDLTLWIQEHLDADLSVPALAERMAMSQRNFARAFASEVGGPPGEYVRKTRLEAARRLLEDSRLQLEQVAGRCGYGSVETMRRAFLRQLRVSPGDYRRRFRPSAS